MSNKPVYMNVPTSSGPMDLQEAYAEALLRWPDFDTHSGRERLKARNIAGLVYQGERGSEHYVQFKDLPAPSMSEYDEACQPW